MAEAMQSFNKYFGPDFDPRKMLSEKQVNKLMGKKKVKSGPKVMNIRMMLPFSMSCETCGEYNYIGTKFNSRVEPLKERTVLGLMRYRFYGKCKHCQATYTFLTDPEHSDYVLETGGKRTYEAFKDADFAEAELEKKRLDELGDQAKQEEYKIYDTAEEMRQHDQLEGIRQINRRQARRNDLISKALQMLEKKKEEVEKKEEEEDEETEGRGRGEGEEEGDESDDDFFKQREKMLNSTVEHVDISESDSEGILPIDLDDFVDSKDSGFVCSDSEEEVKTKKEENPEKIENSGKSGGSGALGSALKRSGFKVTLKAKKLKPEEISKNEKQSQPSGGGLGLGAYSSSESD